jgi:hypothetical protein
MKFEKQMERFVVRFVLGAVILAGLCVAVYAETTRIVSGTGSATAETPSEAVRLATDIAGENLQSACSNGWLNGWSTSQNCREMGVPPVSSCIVRITAVCHTQP